MKFLASSLEKKHKNNLMLILTTVYKVIGKLGQKCIIYVQVAPSSEWSSESEITPSL